MNCEKCRQILIPAEAPAYTKTVVELCQAHSNTEVLAALVLEREALKQELAKAQYWISQHSDTWTGDWACATCKPHSDMLIEGFVCAVCEAKSAVVVEPEETAT